ncbi:MAG: hypothetical protein NVV60_02045 [Luteimonas sp.]|nr:hypothetical protein [Luteimonas sp.]
MARSKSHLVEFPWLAQLSERLEQEAKIPFKYAVDADFQAMPADEEAPDLGLTWVEDNTPQEQLAVFNRLLRSDGIEVVWRAIERRVKPREIVAQDELPSPRSGIDLGNLSLSDVCLLNTDPDFHQQATNFIPDPDGWNHSPVDAAECLVAAVESALNERVLNEGRRVRNERLKAITTTVERLLAQIEPLYSEQYGTGIYKTQRRFTRFNTSKMHAESIANDWIRQTNAKRVHKNEYAIAHELALHLARNPEIALKGILADVQAWATTPPIVPQPDSETAQRQLFIRRMTKYFRTSYGPNSPLHECTLVLAKAFFENASRLAKSDIAQIAPLK